MVVLVMENMPAGLRGELTRWMLEAKAGVLIGNVSAAVRELLWKKVIDSDAGGSAILVFSSDTEQGFDMRMHGCPYRSVVDIEGIFLIKTTLQT